MLLVVQPPPSISPTLPSSTTAPVLEASMFSITQLLTCLSFPYSSCFLSLTLFRVMWEQLVSPTPVPTSPAPVQEASRFSITELLTLYRATGLLLLPRPVPIGPFRVSPFMSARYTPLYVPLKSMPDNCTWL